jgi:thymidylate kinase
VYVVDSRRPIEEIHQEIVTVVQERLTRARKQDA